VLSDFLFQATPEEQFLTITVLVGLLVVCGVVWLINKRKFRGWNTPCSITIIINKMADQWHRMII